MTKLSPLEYITLSGGLFTENLILKIRDKPDTYDETKWNSFGDNWQDEKKKYKEIWDWAKRTYDTCSKNFDDWSAEDRFKKWIKPLLEKLGHKPKIKKKIEIDRLSEEEKDNFINKIVISHEFENDGKIVLQCCIDKSFDNRVESNYENKNQHDNLQRYILLKENIKWGFISNGRKFRLLGEYSNIYSKGYIEFNIDSIIIARNEAEFRIFYTLFHSTRFDETYGLDVSAWTKKQSALWKNLLKKQKKNPDAMVIDEKVNAEETLNIFKIFLEQLIKKARKSGLMSINSSEVENFINKLKNSHIDLSPHGREFYLKLFEKIISDINENKSILIRLKDRSQNQGVEIGKKLRKNVHNVLELMGENFILSNPKFSADIMKGKVNISDFFNELLRIAYRIIFILYAESKELLPSANTIYQSDIGITEIRKLAEFPIRVDHNTDLWERLKILFKFIYQGNKSLGINAFGGDIFNPENTPMITGQKYNLTLQNSSLLSIIKELTIMESERTLQRINYVEIGEEEIGGIYESLLDYIPRYVQNDKPSYHFILEAIDAERKETGSYYTTKGLIDIILKTALKPVIDKKLLGLVRKRDKLETLLNIKICDPACGGGSFLLNALDYMGKLYAQIETENEFPPNDILRNARRKILQNCIYGVDQNPMAIELSKISLWLKASVKDKPLTFLDNHIKTGNSLIGFCKKQEIISIPNNAFNIVKGNKKTGIKDEDRNNLNIAKKTQNSFKITIDSKKKTRLLQSTLLEPYQKSEKLSDSAIKVFEMNEDNIIDQKKKISCYHKLLQTNSYKNINIQANLWTGSFFWEMGDKFTNNIPTDKLINSAKKGNLIFNSEVIKKTEYLSKNYKFFNWYLEFPEIFHKKNPGFDCIITNPPWENLKLNENEFFQKLSKDIIDAPNQAQRQRKILKLSKSNLKSEKKIFNLYKNYWLNIKKQTYYYKNSQFYKNSSDGRIELSFLFIERILNLLNNTGRTGFICPSALISGKASIKLFSHILNKDLIENIFDFHNNNKIFPIADRFHFSILILKMNSKKIRNILTTFSAWDPLEVSQNLEKYENGELDNTKLEKYKNIKEGGYFLELSKQDFQLFNPNLKNCPIFINFRDAEISKKIYNEFPIIIKEENEEIISNPWNLDFKTVLDVSGDSKYFMKKNELLKIGKIQKGIIHVPKEDIDNKYDRYLPLYEGKSFFLYDHRYNKVTLKKDQTMLRKFDVIKVDDNEHSKPDYYYEPYYFISEDVVKNKFPKWKYNWFFGYRNVSGKHNLRSFVCSVFPKRPVTNKVIIILFGDEISDKHLGFIGNLSSLAFDFILRTKLTGTDVTQYIFKQLPIIPPNFYSKELIAIIKPKILELIYTANDLSDFALDFQYKGDPFKWEANKRLELMAELNAIYFLLYNIDWNYSKYITQTFYIIKERQFKEFGQFKTLNLIEKYYKSYQNNEEFMKIIQKCNLEMRKNE